MVRIEILLDEGKIGKISELELERYVNFFENSYLDNFNHSRTNIEQFPRWSIISGYPENKVFGMQKYRSISHIMPCTTSRSSSLQRNSG